MTVPSHSCNRREFLAATAAIASGAAVARPLAATAAPVEVAPASLGKAEHCIFLWLAGGMAQIDTFDPKRLGDPKGKKPGSAYESIPTAVPGVEVCKFLERTAVVMDRVTAVRTMHHEVINEHAAATH